MYGDLRFEIKCLSSSSGWRRYCCWRSISVEWRARSPVFYLRWWPFCDDDGTELERLKNIIITKKILNFPASFFFLQEQRPTGWYKNVWYWETWNYCKQRTERPCSRPVVAPCKRTSREGIVEWCVCTCRPKWSSPFHRRTVRSNCCPRWNRPAANESDHLGRASIDLEKI